MATLRRFDMVRLRGKMGPLRGYLSNLHLPLKWLVLKRPLVAGFKLPAVTLRIWPTS